MEEQRKTLFGHPVGLYVLFFTEMWERFSYYGMRAILVLYMTTSISDDTNPGMGLDSGDALSIYGWYTMLVYVMAIPGGWLADRFIGQKKAVILGGLLLVVGQSVLAVDATWAFYSGLGLIILGVGSLKPNISTIVGGLYKPGDPKRDSGFSIFYMGINVGAFFSAIVVGYIGKEFGWHYGFGLAGFLMLLGQATFMAFQKHLKGVGEFTPPIKVEGTTKTKGLSKVEKDRMIVLLLSFLIIIVFWGAFEQAGGLLNIYARDKINRMIGGWEFPTAWFQSMNPFFIILLAVPIAALWNKWGEKRENSSLFKMAVGTIIMGFGFLLMTFASMEAGGEPYGKAGIYWLILAYLLHTIGELSSSPVSLSFITKLAPVKYASLMMGCYFAATGLGNKAAGLIGEASQSEPIKMELAVNAPRATDSTFTAGNLPILQYEDLAQPESADDPTVAQLTEKGSTFKLKSLIYPEGNSFALVSAGSGQDAKGYFKIDEETNKRIIEDLKKNEVTKDAPYHTLIAVDNGAAKGASATEYEGSLVIDEIQNKLEFKTFTFVFGFTVAFGLLLLVFLKKLKALTHGAEDLEVEGGH